MSQPHQEVVTLHGLPVLRKAMLVLIALTLLHQKVAFDSVSERDVHGALAGRYKNSTAPRLSLPASSGMNKTLNNDNSKPPRRIDTAGCRSSLKDGSTINKEEAKRNRKERQDGLSRRVLSTLCPCWTALATVRPEHATELRS